MTIKTRLKIWSWYGFDIGNSAHALMISTVGFALYFRQYLFVNHPNPDFLWAMLTSMVLMVSAVCSPLLASWFSGASRSGKGLTIITLVCVFSTGLLSVRWDDNLVLIVSLYVISAVTYYVALPVYNGLLPSLNPPSLQETSGRGWGLGYLGGIAIVAICLVLGLLDKPVAERPDLYRLAFLVSAAFNFLLSLPILLVAWGQDGKRADEVPSWTVPKVFAVFKRDKNILPIFVSYWLLGEGATIVLYFTAIYLAEFAGMQAPEILKLTLVLQGGAIFTTWFFGTVAHKTSAKKVFVIVSLVWVIIPVLLWLISKGIRYWPALAAISLVIGAYHSVIRGTTARISKALVDPLEQGALWGFLEVFGRISQVLGPLLVGLVAFFVPLNDALLVGSLFPIAAILVLALWRSKW